MDSSNWRDKLDERQQKELELAIVYARDFHHGTTGHSQFMLIAHMAKVLDATAQVASDAKYALFIEPEIVESTAHEEYSAYGAVTDHKNYQGLPMPMFDDLTDKIKEAWLAGTRVGIHKGVVLGVSMVVKQIQSLL